MGQMKPATRCLDGMRALAVLHLFYGVIEPAVNNLFFLDYGVLHAVYQSPANSSAASGINKTILGARIQGIFPVHEFRMKGHVALLAL